MASDPLPPDVRSHPIFGVGGQSIGMISGENPKFAAEVQGAETLHQHLTQMGLRFEPTRGKYGTPENSAIVHNPTREQLFELGRKFGQESVVYGKNGKHELIYTNGPLQGLYHPSISEKHEWHREEPPDNFTELPGGKGYASLAFDFDQKLRAPLQNLTPPEAGDPAKKSEVSLAEALFQVYELCKSLETSAERKPHPHAYPWHDSHTSHYPVVVGQGLLLHKAEAPQYQEVHPDEFEAAVSKHPDQTNLDNPRDYTNKRTFLSQDRNSGYALQPNGELNHVFSLVPGQGQGSAAVQHAISQGAKHLTAFDGHLPAFYRKHGFQETGREKNWTPGGPDVVSMALGKSEEDGSDTSTYAKFASPYGTVTPGRQTDLSHYPYEGKAPDVERAVKDHGYQSYFAGGKYGRPDLSQRNYNTGHLMIHGGGDEATNTWRQMHELAHALTLPQVNQIYGDGKRVGKLGTHRSQRDAMRAVHWEWLAAHKQRELSKLVGIHIPDEQFHKELNTVMHDAVHRAVTGQLAEPSSEGFEPHGHMIPLQHALNTVQGEARNLGLVGMDDTLQRKSEETPVADNDFDPRAALRQLAQGLTETLQKNADAIEDLCKREAAALEKKSPPGRKEEVEKLKAKGMPASEAFGIAWKQHNKLNKLDGALNDTAGSTSGVPGSTPDIGPAGGGIGAGMAMSEMTGAGPMCKACGMGHPAGRHQKGMRTEVEKAEQYESDSRTSAGPLCKKCNSNHPMGKCSRTIKSDDFIDLHNEATPGKRIKEGVHAGSTPEDVTIKEISAPGSGGQIKPGMKKGEEPMDKGEKKPSAKCIKCHRIAEPADSSGNYAPATRTDKGLVCDWCAGKAEGKTKKAEPVMKARPAIEGDFGGDPSTPTLKAPLHAQQMAVQGAAHVRGGAGGTHTLPRLPGTSALRAPAAASKEPLRRAEPPMAKPPGGGMPAAPPQSKPAAMPKPAAIKPPKLPGAAPAMGKAEPAQIHHTPAPAKQGTTLLPASHIAEPSGPAKPQGPKFSTHEEALQHMKGADRSKWPAGKYEVKPVAKSEPMAKALFGGEGLNHPPRAAGPAKPLPTIPGRSAAGIRGAPAPGGLAQPGAAAFKPPVTAGPKPIGAAVKPPAKPAPIPAAPAGTAALKPPAAAPKPPGIFAKLKSAVAPASKPAAGSIPGGK